MRIGFDGRYIQDRYHGIGRYAFELLRHLLALDDCHRYVVFWNPALPNSRFDLEALLAHPRVESILLTIPLFWPQEQLVFPLLAGRYRLDLFHAPYAAIPLALPCPLILTVHDLIFERYPHYMPQGWARPYYRALMSTGLRRSSGVIAVSEATRHDLLHYYAAPRARIDVIYLAVDQHYAPPSTEAIARARERYHLPARYLLHVGIRRPHKNVEAILRALGRLRQQIPHTLVLVGEQDTRFVNDLPSLISAQGLSGRVMELGTVAEADLPAIYGGAEAALVPSLIEGFGLTALEALACGVPVMASNRSSLPEVVGDAALLIDPTDEVAMAAALLRLLSSQALQQELRTRGLQRAQEFSWSWTALQTRAAYRAVKDGYSLGSPGIDLASF